MRVIDRAGDEERNRRADLAEAMFRTIVRCAALSELRHHLHPLDDQELRQQGIIRRALHHIETFCLSWPGAAVVVVLLALFLWLI